jgi:hypothetical protein
VPHSSGLVSPGQEIEVVLTNDELVEISGSLFLVLADVRDADLVPQGAGYVGPVTLPPLDEWRFALPAPEDAGEYDIRTITDDGGKSSWRFMVTG